MAGDRKIEMHWFCSSCRAENLGRHKRCQSCGDPKDASEPWVMPGDTRAAPTVTDPALLRQASAGPDWQCGFCGSHQRRGDGRCAQCGAAQAEGGRVPTGGAAASAQRFAPAPGPGGAGAKWVPPHKSSTSKIVALVFAGSFALTIPLCCVFAMLLPAPVREVHKSVVAIGAEVDTATWLRRQRVERRSIVDEEGFVEQRPADAFDIVSQGQRHHHDEQVLDHYETEHYTEQVPYQDTETYTEQESCGEDCSESAQSCHEVCTPDDNGFASCHDECSGGGRSCTTRYCSVTRTRSVTRYRSEPRTRQVPRYRAEPRFAERFEWHVWRWGFARNVDIRGTSAEPPRWPTEEELTPPTPLGPGEEERHTPEETYRIELVGIRDRRRYPYQPPGYADFRWASSHPRWFLTTAGGDTQLRKPMPDRPQAGPTG